MSPGDIDLVILDLMLPGLDGIEICRRLRQSHPNLPVIMLTALGEEDDRIAGLEVGADDYVTKPFSPRELVLRVESVLRRGGADRAAGGAARLGPLTLDTAARRACKGDTELSLTVRELDLLAYLMAHPGTAFTRDPADVGGLGLDVRRPVHGDRARPAGPGEDRGRSAQPAADPDRVGRRLPDGGRRGEPHPATSCSTALLWGRRRSRCWPGC